MNAACDGLPRLRVPKRKAEIAEAFAVKTRPVVVHSMTSAILMSAWRLLYSRGDIALERRR
jgi:hypothetical protein